MLLLEVLFLLVRQKHVFILLVSILLIKCDSDWDGNGRKKTSGSDLTIICRNNIELQNILSLAKDSCFGISLNSLIS